MKKIIMKKDFKYNGESFKSGDTVKVSESVFNDFVKKHKVAKEKRG